MTSQQRLTLLHKKLDAAHKRETGHSGHGNHNPGLSMGTMRKAARLIDEDAQPPERSVASQLDRLSAPPQAVDFLP